MTLSPVSLGLTVGCTSLWGPTLETFRFGTLTKARLSKLWQGMMEEWAASLGIIVS
jgi:hypothetical protein